MLAYAYSSASAFSNHAAAMYHMTGGVAGMPRGASGTSLDGSGPIRPIATSGSFSNALTAGAEMAPPAAPAAAPAALAADAPDAAALAADAAARPPVAAQSGGASPLPRAAEGGAELSGGGGALPHNPPGGHMFFPVGGLPMGHLPMQHMMPMVGPMGMFYGSGYANMPLHLAGMAGMHPAMGPVPVMAWPTQPQPAQPR